MVQMHRPQKDNTRWLIAILGLGLLLQFALSPFLSTDVREGIMMMAMVGMGLWILASGLLSMKSAPRWHTLRLVGFFLLVGGLLIQNHAPLVWQITSALGAVLALLVLIFRPLWLRAFVYAWTLLHAIVLELLYLLPLMSVMEPPLLDVLLMGSLFVTLGTSGLFSLKYSCMMIATGIRREQAYTEMFSTWLETRFPFKQAWKRDGVLLGIVFALLLGAYGGVLPQQTALYSALALLMFPE